MRKYCNLVFEGGGVRGIAYVGALEYLISKPLKEGDKPIELKEIKRIAGTSAGAIIAFLLSLNYSVAEIRNIFETINFNDFTDKRDLRGWFTSITGTAKRWWAEGFWSTRDFWVTKESYMYEGGKALQWIQQKIEEKLGKKSVTFQELKDSGYKELYIVATNLSQQRTEVFSAKHTPNMPIDLAVRASMAIPLFFKGVNFSIGQDGTYNPCGTDIYVDGGITSNYPIEIFDDIEYIVNQEYRKKIILESLCNMRTESMFSDLMRTRSLTEPKEPGLYRFINAETIGFKVDTIDEIETYSNNIEKRIKVESYARLQIKSLWDYFKSLAGIVYNSQDLIRGKTENLRTVYIDSKEISAINFSLTQEEKNALMKSGHDACTKFNVQYSEKMNKWKEKNRFNVKELDNAFIENYFREIREIIRTLNANVDPSTSSIPPLCLPMSSGLSFAATNQSESSFPAHTSQDEQKKLRKIIPDKMRFNM